MTMYRVQIDTDKCKRCYTCEDIFQGFRSVYGGMILVSKTDEIDKHLRIAAESARNSCPEKAIVFKQCPGNTVTNTIHPTH